MAFIIEIDKFNKLNDEINTSKMYLLSLLPVYLIDAIAANVY